MNTTIKEKQLVVSKEQWHFDGCKTIIWMAAIYWILNKRVGGNNYIINDEFMSANNISNKYCN